MHFLRYEHIKLLRGKLSYSDNASVPALETIRVLDKVLEEIGALFPNEVVEVKVKSLSKTRTGRSKAK
jgi:hypothetical protein